MATNSALTGQQLIQLAADYNGLGNQVREILNSGSNLPPDVSNALASDLTTLSNIAANLATWGAAAVFADSDSAFATISAATQAANAKVAQLKADVAKVNSVVNIVGSAVSLGVAFGTGNWVSVLSAATNLGQAVSNA